MLLGLSQKSEHLNKVIHYFDQGYKVAVGRAGMSGDGRSRVSGVNNYDGTDAIEEQVRMYILDALDTVAKEIDSIAITIVDDMDQRIKDTESLSIQADMIKTNMELGKNYFMLQKFAAISCVAAESREPAAKKSVMPFFEQAESDHLYEEDYQKKEALRSVSSASAKLEAMGQCLYISTKETDKSGVDGLAGSMSGLDLNAGSKKTEFIPKISKGAAGGARWKPRLAANKKK
jgi:hypothetical protein